ncbi:MAG: LamG domain-containing protein [Cyclobacteriaceae bacterium]|nr:LamG domain-containing protein [Cyclobacteriaceae bacterium]
MKLKQLLLIGMLIAAFGCKDGYIDDIKGAPQGADVTAPTITFNYPLEGTSYRVLEDIAPIDINVKVSDDIEVAEVTINLDGEDLITLNKFIDYRNAIAAYTYETLENGDHELTVTAVDGAGKTTTQSINFKKEEPYDPVYDGEMFYMPFNGDYTEQVTITKAIVSGIPQFSDDFIAGGKSYLGANDAYLTFPTNKLTLSNNFSAVFWYKCNNTPDRSGILTISAPDPAHPTAPNNRTKGLRLFRENIGGNQVVKLNVGNGTQESWFDGGATAKATPGTWIHIAFVITPTGATLYINGNVVSTGTFPVDESKIDWAGCDIMNIASGAPRFLEWAHRSDLSNYDEMRLFNKALTQAEIQAIINNED